MTTNESELEPMILKKHVCSYTRDFQLTELLIYVSSCKCPKDNIAINSVKSYLINIL